LTDTTLDNNTCCFVGFLFFGFIKNPTHIYIFQYTAVGGGKPKMFFHFRNTTGVFPMVGNEPPPATHDDQQALIDKLQSFKTDVFKSLLETEAKARPGVLELLDEALQDDRIGVGVCSAATKEAAVKTLDITLGAERVRRLDVCLLGDDVAAKKPDPMIYNVARERLGVTSPDRCVVVEDSLVGLRAAKGAQMRCIITYTESTVDADFYGEGADAKVPDLGSRGITLESIFGPLREQGVKAELLVGMKDPLAAQVLPTS
jgi:HAD superfamily hydrolase (TIGR01509 family)